MRVWPCHRGKHFSPWPWFSFVCSLWNPSPGSWSLDGFAHKLLAHIPCCPKNSFCKCPMECVLCSRYCIGTRALNLDRPGLVPILMEEDSLTQSVQIQLPFSPTHDPVLPIIPVSSAGLILKGLNGIRGPCTPILTWLDATPYEFLYKDLILWIVIGNLCSYWIFCGGKKQTGQNKPIAQWEEKGHWHVRALFYAPDNVLRNFLIRLIHIVILRRKWYFL